MSTDAFEFDCAVRKRAGTGGSRAVRRDGWVPAVLYGGDKEPVNIKLRYNQVLKAYQTGRLIDVLSIINVEDPKDLTRQSAGRRFGCHKLRGSGEGGSTEVKFGVDAVWQAHVCA